MISYFGFYFDRKSTSSLELCTTRYEEKNNTSLEFTRPALRTRNSSLELCATRSEDKELRVVCYPLRREGILV